MRCDITVPSNLDEGLLRHLVDAWHGKKTRAFGRLQTETPVKICVGMVNAHYFMSGGVEFAKLLSSAQAYRHTRNPFVRNDPAYLNVDNVKRDYDVWDNAFDAGGHIPESAELDDAELIPYDWQVKQQLQLREQKDLPKYKNIFVYRMDY